MQINILVVDQSTLIPQRHDRKGRMPIARAGIARREPSNRREKGRLRLRPFTNGSYPPAAGRRSASVERSHL